MPVLQHFLSWGKLRKSVPKKHNKAFTLCSLRPGRKPQVTFPPVLHLIFFIRWKNDVVTFGGKKIQNKTSFWLKLQKVNPAEPCLTPAHLKLLRMESAPQSRAKFAEGSQVILELAAVSGMWEGTGSKVKLCVWQSWIML